MVASNLAASGEIEKYIPQAQVIIDELLAESEEGEVNDWKFVHEKKGVKVWRKKPKGESLYLMKGYGTIHMPMETIKTLLLDFEEKARYDPMWITGERLEASQTAADGTMYETLRMCFKSPGPVTNRDFVVFGIAKTLPDGTFVQVSKSITHPGAPEDRNYVRGELRASGFILKPIDGGKAANVIYIVGVDPKGSVPKFVVNLVSTKQPMNINTIKDYLATGKYAKGIEKSG